MRYFVAIAAIAGALVWAYYLGRMSAADPVWAPAGSLPVAGDLADAGAEPPPATPPLPRSPIPVTPPADDASAGEDRSGRGGESRPKPYHVPRVEPSGNPGLDAARMLYLSYQGEWGEVRRAEKVRFPYPGTAREALDSREHNPDGLQLPEAQLQALDEELREFRFAEREHWHLRNKEEAEGMLRAVENGTAIVWRKGDPYPPFPKEALGVECVGPTWMGPEPETMYVAPLWRHTHPRYWAIVDELAELNRQRNERIRFYLQAYGYRR